MSFDFDLDHACGFYSALTQGYRDSPEKYELSAELGESDPGAGSVEHTPVATAFARVGKKMLFVFNYEDEWCFTIEFMRLGAKKPKTRYPRLIVSEGDAPDQYPDMEDE